MEHHDVSPQEDLQNSPRVPDSLLSGVLKRLEQRQLYLGPDVAREELVAALSHPQWEIRAAAVRALGKTDDQASRDLLLAALADEHRLVRAAAVRALGNLGVHIPLEKLLLAAKDPAWEVRETVVLVLGELGIEGQDFLHSLLLAAQQDEQSAVRDAATYALQSYETRSVSVTSPSIEMQVTQQAVHPRHIPFSRLVARSALILVRQVALIHKSVWLGTVLLMFFWGVQYVHIPLISRGDIHAAGLYLALFTAISAASGTAFIYGGERDAAFELTLATPTSTRVIMLSRFLLVVGYNVLLAVCASTVVGALQGGDVWNLVQLWFGPMMLLASLSLTLSLFVGSWIATSIALVVELSQTFVFTNHLNMPTLDFVISSNWRTSPLILLLALLLLAFAAYYAPRQPRLAAF